MVNQNNLEQGQCYFLLLFYNSEIEIPKIESYIYIEKNLPNEEQHVEDIWYFQDPSSYLKYGSFTKQAENIKYEIFEANEDALFQMYDLDGLIERLMKA